MNNKIELKPVKDLLGNNFFIPGYQRGYRWKTRQVQDLLDDIQDFIDKGAEGKYCLQPLVVKKHKVNETKVREEIKSALDVKTLDDVKELLQDQWDVVDGQQRLTTVFILLQFLSKPNDALYSINYETRENSKEFLRKIDENEAENYIDYTHICNTKKVIETWFGTKREKKSMDGQKSMREPNKQVFLQTLLHQTEFIWYELTEGQEPIQVFTRLNIGKISLTNAELVKALLLNKLNFTDGKLSANEVALVWDQMEYTLQNDRFWCFIHEEGFSQPTRIDFLLELVMKIRNSKKGSHSGVNNTDFWLVEQKELGNDHYRTFRYFYQLLLKKTPPDGEKTPFRLVWDEIVRVFELLKEWYNDNKCYHYIGFLTTWLEWKKAKGKSLVDYIEDWQKKMKKDVFVEECLVKQIRESVKDVKDLNQQYEIEENGKTKSKTACYPLLLLFNVQTIVDKNSQFEQTAKFNALSFERFPFDLFKKEKGWDIEHIASNADNSIQSVEEAIEWLRLAVVGLVDAKKKKAAEDKIGELESHKNEKDTDKLELDEQLYQLCQDLDGSNLDSKAKNKIWNFCLLDQSTNRGYGNSIFATKRKWLLNRERGLDVNGSHLSDDRKVYIPPCTLRVFTKFYSPNATDLSAWKEEDAMKYKDALDQTLTKFMQ